MANSKKGTKAHTVSLSPKVSNTLRSLHDSTRISMSAIVEKALDLYFRKHGYYSRFRTGDAFEKIVK